MFDQLSGGHPHDPRARGGHPHDPRAWLAELDDQQRAAACHGGGPLLVLAGAGSGKTRTLAARVAVLLERGAAPQEVLLLTFSRRAAEAMLSRVESIVGPAGRGVVGGTFHAVANRLLRLHGRAVGLGPSFGLIDAGDSADLLDLVRDDLGVARGTRRFPRKDTLAALHSRTVNALTPLPQVVGRWFPWCADHVETIGAVFREYTVRKRAQRLLDYDDLLLFWRALAQAEPALGARFAHVLVDEYQDTNALQVDVVAALRTQQPDLTVVGDDAQAIYGFRSASVEGILGFAERFPGAAVVRLERSYRCTQPVLEAANGVVEQMVRAHRKVLWSPTDGPRPRLHACTDEAEQSQRVCDAVLDRRERGMALREQAVLVRTGHHSAHLELELARRGIPFVKYGGLRFLESAHVKDLLAILRLLDDDRDEVAWFRVLQLLDGVGPAAARRAMRELGVSASDGAPDRPEHAGAPAAPVVRPSPLALLLTAPPAFPRGAELPALQSCLRDCSVDGVPVAAQVARIRAFYAPLCARKHGDAAARLADLEQLEAVAGAAGSRSRFVADLVLDPPNRTGALAGPPLLDEDWLTISTIHAAKGLEWQAVSVLHVTDGNLPSDMSTGSADELDEERRLLYVALTRAQRELDVFVPQRYYSQRFGTRDTYGLAPRSRFLTPTVVSAVDEIAPTAVEPQAALPAGSAVAVDAVLADLWG